ncbi:hypothetical protein [Mesorhizobium caraganae]|uniref:hypothetical protein n=1 Tax=Mesorhizobium caraganae TaxID=483206 RepID=UPI003339D51A
MVLKKQQINRLKDYNRTIMVIGKFNSLAKEDEEKRSIFDTASPTYPDLKPVAVPSVDEVFKHVNPQILRLEGMALRIGDTDYESYRLVAPYADTGGAKTIPTPLLPDDALFDAISESKPRSNDVLRAQEIGGKLFKRLIANLDVLARFMGGRFTKAMLTMADGYASAKAVQIFLKVRENVDFSPGRISEAHFQNPIVAAAVLKYLLAAPADALRALKQLTAAYSEFAFFNDAGLQRDAVNSIVGAMQHLREVVLERKAPDAVWEEMKTRDPFTSDWLDNNALDPRFNLGVDDIVGNGRFIEIYLAFRQRSDAVHAFARSLPHQSFFFAWLMSKYESYNSADATLQKVGLKVFNKTMKGKAGVRFGVGPADFQRNVEIIGKAGNEGLTDYLNAFQDKSLKGALKGILESFSDVLIAPISNKTAFTRDKLNENIDALFISLAFRIGGPASEALASAQEYANRIAEVYHEVLRAAGEGETEKAKFENVIAAMAARPSDHVDVAKLRADVLAGLKKAKLGDAERAVRKALDVTVKSYATAAQSFLRGRLKAVEEQLGMQAHTMRGLLALRRMMDVTPSQTKTALVIRMVTDHELKQLVDDIGLSHLGEEAAAAQKKAVNEAYAEMASGRPITAPLPADVASKIQAWSSNSTDPVPNVLTGKVKVKNKEVSEFTIDREKKIFQMSVADPGILATPVEEMQGEISRLPGTDTLPLNPSDIDADKLLSSAMQDAVRREASKPNKEDLEKYGELSAFMDQVADAYANKGTMSGELHERLRNEVRSFVLGEYLAAAPEDQSPLGKADLSQGSAFAMDAVREIGTTSLPGTLIANNPDDGSAAGLNRIPFDQYYPVPNDAKAGPQQIANVIRFHLNLAQGVIAIADYLRDVLDLRRLVAALPNGARLSVINMTLAEFNVALANDSLQHFEEESPGFIYLPTAAQANQAEVQKLSQRYSGSAVDGTRRPETGALIPIIISATKLAGDGLQLPALWPGDPETSSPGNPEMFEARHTAGTEASEWKNAPSLIWTTYKGRGSVSPMMALLIGATADDERVLGDIAKGKSGDEFVSWVAKTYDVEFDKGEPLVAFLRRIWLNQRKPNDKPGTGGTDGPASRLLDTLVAVRLINLAILERTARGGGNRKDFGLFLDVLGDMTDGTSPALAAAFSLPLFKSLTLKNLLVMSANTTDMALTEAMATLQLANKQGTWLCADISEFGRRINLGAARLDWLNSFNAL